LRVFVLFLLPGLAGNVAERLRILAQPKLRHGKDQDRQSSEGFP